MPEEIEVPTESLRETIDEHAHAAKHGHGHPHANKESWIFQVALGSAIFAVLAAISALLAGHHANEATLERIESANFWSYYQSKSIKSNMLMTKLDLLQALGREAKPEERTKLGTYDEELKKIEESAHEKEKSSEEHLHHHNVLARAVTFFQIAIAMAAISVLTRKKPLWFAGLGVAVVGAFFLIQGIL